MDKTTAAQQTAEQRYHDIATELFNANGKRPTIAQVREASGSGSFSTITKAMQSWQQEPKAEAENKAEAKKELELTDLPPELLEKAEGLTGVINGVILEAWGVASKQAETSITLAQQKNDEALASLKADAAKSLEEEQAQAELAQAELANEADNLADQLALAKKQNEELQKDLESQQAAIAQQKTDFEALLKTKDENAQLLKSKLTSAESLLVTAQASEKDLKAELMAEVKKAATAEGQVLELEKQLTALQAKPTTKPAAKKPVQRPPASKLRRHLTNKEIILLTQDLETLKAKPEAERSTSDNSEIKKLEKQLALSQ